MASSSDVLDKTAEVSGSLDMALAHAGRLLAQDPALALAQADEILAAIAHPQAQLIKGQALRLLGRLPEAQAVLQPLTQDQPRAAGPACELGLTLAGLGDAEGAIHHLRRAVALRDDLGRAWSVLAGLLRAAGEDQEATKAEMGAVRASTRDPQLIEAAIAMGEARFETAEPILKARLAAKPDDIAATRMMGELAWRMGQLDEAITYLLRTLELAPGFAAAREFLVRLLSQANRLPEALDHAAILSAQTPQNADNALLLASMMVLKGNQQEAKAIYEDLLRQYPDQPRIWMNLGHVQKTLGDQPAAIAAYRHAIAQSPTLGEAWWSLANLKTVKFPPEDRAAMLAAIEQGPALEDLLHLHFALGKALEDAGIYADSFAHYDQGNRLRRPEVLYDADETHLDAAEHAALFTAPFYAPRLSEGGCTAPDPIFVLGLPRSGSTLVEQILSSHSQIEGTHELPEMMMLTGRLKARVDQGEFASYSDLLRSLSPADRTRLGEEYIERTRIHRSSDRPYFIDKMPNNWQNTGLIHLILPRAKIIDARRHPMGCCFSGWKQHFARGQAFTYDLGEIGRYYRDYVAQMAAFDAQMPGVVHRVIYEEMVADTQAQVASLLAYVGVEFEEECLAFWRNKRAVRTASSEQVRQPIYRDGLEQWTHFNEWLSPLRDALGPVVEAFPAPPADWAEHLGLIG
ncbi:sulfotransferase family protein [Novosphingobium umbonatum]|uniref:Sulfotransferase family protein n=1 Tax=Novosphingobium umbonatum TaxID=1908524 RepID=A0A437NCJ2_9SPHN|nr:tetratricopeptide repeat-containing sulfotransferase family protein [Novosphingobium umbonatum]RVU07674.1 sulfotransferase family protein [Novosphingobium umbonatum]